MKWILPVALFVSLSACAQDEFNAQRERMVQEQIADRDISDPAVLRAMRTVPRHLFVPELSRPGAYDDHPLSIGHGQTISQPYIVALMTQMLEVRSSDRVLEIGTGSGYQAAVLSLIAKHVYTIEIVPELARSAESLLRKLGYQNVTVKYGDGYLGWPEEGPFNRIILTAAPPDVPQALIQQLQNGGRLVAPVGFSPLSQELVLIEKRADGTIVRRAGIPVRFVPMVRGK